MYYKIPLFGILIFVLGCTSGTENTSGNQQSEITYPEFPSVETDDVFVYECTDSLQFTAHVTVDSTWLILADTAVKLNPVQSASGAKYGSGNYFYWSKGKEALLQIPDESLRNCQSMPQERSWQAAKLRGVDFRALGQEPGWFLEIIEDERIKYVGNYGQDTVYTPVPDPTINKRKNETAYHIETENHRLTVKIRDTLCTDIMSGFEFPASVTVTVDGETYRGCGKSL